MRKVLLIQSRKTPDLCQKEFDRFKRVCDGKAELVFESSVNLARDWQKPETLVRGYDAVLMGGSSDFFFDGGRDETKPERAETRQVLERMRPLVSYVLQENIPMLAVCLGHQIVAEVYGGHVTHDHAQRKMGTYELQLTDEGKNDPLFSQMPATFFAHYAHRDSVTSLPKDAVLLAQSSMCRFSALRYGDSLYTMQFHPELEAADMLDSSDAVAEYLTGDKSIEEIVQETPLVAELVPLFLETIVGT